MAKVLPKAGPSLVALAQQRLRTEKIFDPLTLEPRQRIRVSSLSELCAREEVLASRLKVKRTDLIEPHLQLTFDHGTGLHWTLQNVVLPALGPHFVGQWTCKVCGRQHGSKEAFVPRPEKCADGKCVSYPDAKPQDLFEYVEQFYVNEEFRLQGHPDGYLSFPDMDGLGVLEGKSISDRRFKDVRDVPDFGHVLQLQAYLWLSGLTWGMILYWNKGAWKDQWVEHYVERDDDTIERIQKMLRDIWDGIATGALPERLCSSDGCSRAEGCPLVRQCFELEETAP